MEREETEEKESVRKTEKERHEMKYKVGDKVRVKENLPLYMKAHCVSTFSPETLKYNGMIVTVSEVKKDQYKIEEDKGFYDWYEDMFEPVEDELTAEEAIMLRSEMCVNTSCCDCKLSRHNNGTGTSCNEFSKKYPGRVIEILKQRKKEHEKKEAEVTQKIYCLVVDEERKVVHEEEIGNSDSCMDVLKNYCENHDGKFFSLMEFRYEVKQ